MKEHLLQKESNKILPKNKDGVIDLVAIGEKSIRQVHRNLNSASLYEKIIRNREGYISKGGALVVMSGDFGEARVTKRYIVEEEKTKDTILWNEKNTPIKESAFDFFSNRLLAYMENKEVYVQYCFLGKNAETRVPLRIITETAWHNLFVHNLLPPMEDVADYRDIQVEWSILHIPGFHAAPGFQEEASSAFVLIHPKERIICICGTHYAGELRRAVFTVANQVFTGRDTLLMRASANIGPDGDVAVFIGRSGTGKTTLALDPQRRFVSDHELGWTEKGLFALETGVYAHAFKQVQREEASGETHIPEVFQYMQQFGAILENVALNLDTREVDFSDHRLTENSRGQFPASFVPNYVAEGQCDHPRHLFLLTCDALGVFPPIARLEPRMAVYGFLSGYTSRVQEVESGEVVTDIQFDTCFGAASISRAAHDIAMDLLKWIEANTVTCWLVNTGWTGEPSSRTSRIPVTVTRALVRAAISGILDQSPYETDPLFQFQIPTQCTGIPEKLLNPRKIAGDAGEYELRANRLAQEFIRDFQQYEQNMPEDMRSLLSGVLSLNENFDLLDDFNVSI